MTDIKRNLHRCIVTASYDRGVEHTLRMWPDIRKVVPDATLHCFYGWQLFDKFYSGNPASMAWKAKMVELFNQEGVFEYGRIPQVKLVDEYLKSGIYCYSTHFGEINCISALKAQAYGCEPVVVNYAALRETVQYGRKVEGDIYDKEVQEEFKKQLILALNMPMPEEKRLKMMKWAKDTYGWEKIAKQWDSELRKEVP